MGAGAVGLVGVLPGAVVLAVAGAGAATTEAALEGAVAGGLALAETATAHKRSERLAMARRRSITGHENKQRRSRGMKGSELCINMHSCGLQPTSELDVKCG